MKLSAQPGRLRPLNDDKARAPKDIHGIAPLKEKLLEWHRATSILGTRLGHAEERNECADDLLETIGALEDDVSTTMHRWRATLQAPDLTGRIGDAEKSAKGIMAALAYYRERLASGPAGQGNPMS